MIAPSERTKPSAARILVVDPCPIVRLGLARLIRDDTSLSIWGETDRPSEALHILSKDRPDLVVTELWFGEESGLELIKHIRARHETLPVLVFSIHDELRYAERVIRAGATGYLMKDEAPDRISGAIRDALDGKLCLSDQVATTLLDGLVGRRKPRASSPVERLSDRELEVFELIGKGLEKREIAERLCLSVKTVENYREHIKTKLRLERFTDLLRFAIEWELNSRFFLRD